MHFHTFAGSALVRRITFAGLFLFVVPGLGFAQSRMLEAVGVVDQTPLDGLSDNESIAVSPDGLYVYLASRTDDAVSVYYRAAATGALQRVQILRDGEDGIDTLARPESVALSPDGAHVYVAASLDSAITVFSRDASNGRLTYAGAAIDGQDGLDSLSGVDVLVVAPDGRHVYAAARGDDSLTVFARDEATGLLTFVEAQVHDAGGETYLRDINMLLISPDGAHVYATGIKEFGTPPATVPFSGFNIFSRDAQSGALTFVDVLMDGIDGDFDLRNGQLKAVSQDGAFVYAPSVNDNSIICFSRNSETGMLTVVQTLTDGMDGVDGLFATRAVVLSPDGLTLYATDVGGDGVSRFSRTAETGLLTFLDVVRNGQDGIMTLDFPQTFAVSPDGANLYVGTDNGASVVVFAIGPGTGALSFVQPVVNGLPQNPLLNMPTALAQSLDGSNVYAVATGSNGLIAYRRDPATGELVQIDVKVDNRERVDALLDPVDVVVSPDGAHVYTAASGEAKIGVFGRDASGTLTYLSAADDPTVLDGVRGLALSPNGQHLYTAASTADRLGAYSRDQMTGNLSFVEAELQGQGGVDGLDGAWDVAVSPDGNHVYVTSPGTSAVSVFARDDSTGTLTFVEVQRDDVAGVFGLFKPGDLAFSGGGLHLYVTSSDVDQSVVVFRRNVTTGALTFLGVQFDGQGGVNGLDGARGVTLAPDGGRVYVAAETDNAVTVFDREWTTGLLSFVETNLDEQNGATGLGGALALLATGDGRHVYVAGNGDNAIQIMRVAAQTSTVDGDEDYELTLNELLRLVQLYNSNGFHCAAPPESTEDGFEPGTDTALQACPWHTSDYAPQDWQIALTELLRAVQLFNAGGYAVCTAGEDGFCPL